MEDSQQHVHHEPVDPAQPDRFPRGGSIDRRERKRVLGKEETTTNSDHETRKTDARQDRTWDQTAALLTSIEAFASGDATFGGKPRTTTGPPKGTGVVSQAADQPDMAGRQSGHWRKTGKRTTCPPGGRRIIRVLRVMMHSDPDSLKASCRSLEHTPKLACPVFHKALTSQFASRTTRQANHWSQMSSTQKPLKPWWGDGPRPTREEMDRRADEAYVSCAQCRLKGSIPNLFPTLCHTVRLSASRM
jgi:hypothetical protein